MKIHVLDVDRLSKRVLGRFWPNMGAKKAENGAKLGSQNDPKSVQNRHRKFIEILIVFGGDLGAILGAQMGFALKGGGGRKEQGGPP